MAINNRARRAGKVSGRGSRAASGGLAAVILLGLIVAFGAVAQAKRKKAPPPPPADVPGHVNYLARELTGVQLDDAAPVTSQIQTLVFDDVERWLGKHPPIAAPGAAGSARNSGAGSGEGSSGTAPIPYDVPYDVRVRRVMDHDFSLLHYPLVGQPAVFARAWQDGELVGAGYMLGWTDQDRTNVLGFFEVPYGPANAANSARPVRPVRLAAVVHFVPSADLHYVFPAPPGGVPAGQFWVLVYGTRLGESHPRLSATLYVFDGQSAKVLWQARDIYDGQLEAERDRIVIRHLKEQEFVQAAALGQAPPRYEAVYKVTPAGLELESDRQIR